MEVNHSNKDPFTKEGLKNYTTEHHHRGSLSSVHVFERDDDWIQIQEIKNSPGLFDKLNPEFNAAMGSFLGMVLGDALGAPFEFTHYIPNPTADQGDEHFMSTGFDQVALWKSRYGNAFRLKVGQWTDDASMGLCLADSLICCEGFDAIDLRRRFHLWWNYGYCNAFGKDEKRGEKGSVGLGGNISLSLREFAHFINKEKNAPEETEEGDINTSGNGSIMRNAAVPIYYKDNLTDALLYAAKQSKTTHQGTEAYECCRLLSYVVIKAMKNPGSTGKTILEDLYEFQADSETIKTAKDTSLISIIQLARSKTGDNKDSNWNWKELKFKYSPTRSQQQPGYIGSYAMDALAMSFHCIYHTDTFEAALMKCANYRGDSDSVCAVTGQIAGAIYGWSKIPKYWVDQILQWDKDDFILLRGYKLFHKHPRKYNTIINPQQIINPPAEAPPPENEAQVQEEEKMKD
jgi:ADP-ribosylglycohydrolase